VNRPTIGTGTVGGLVIILNFINLKKLVFPQNSDFYTLFQRHFKLYDHIYITKWSM
jgi:hypothetical protein